MKVSLLKLLRRKEQPEGNPKSNYRIVVFSICLLISFAFWLMNMLSKKYTESFVFYIQYENLPPTGSRIATTDTIRIKLNTTGYRVLGYKFGILEKYVKIDAAVFKHKENQSYYLLTSPIHSGKIEEQLGDEVKLIDMSPDTLYIRPAEPTTKNKS